MLLLLCSPTLSSGQWTPQSIFKPDSDGEGFISDIAISATGDLFVSGSFSDTLRVPGTEEEWVSRGASDIYLMRMTSDFEVKWLITAGGNTEEDCVPQFGASADFPNFLRIYNDAIYMTGWFLYEADFNNDNVSDVSGNSDGCNYFLAKYDLQGNFLWAATSGRDYMDRLSGFVITPSGAIYLSGTFEDTFDIQDDGVTDPDLFSHAFVDRYDTAGNLISSNVFGGATSEAKQSSVYGMALHLDELNRLHFFARYTGTLTIDEADFEEVTCTLSLFFGCKLSIRFSDDFEVEAVGDQLLFSSTFITQDVDGNTIVLNSPGLDLSIFNKTHAPSASINRDFYINAFDKSGDHKWAHDTEASSSYSDNGPYYVYPTALYAAPDKTTIAGGFIQDGKIDFDSDGEVDLNVPFRNAFIVHYDAQGALLNAFTLNKAATDIDNYFILYELNHLGTSEFIASGVFRGTIQLDPELLTEPIKAEGEQDAILIRYTINDEPLPVTLSSFEVTANGHAAYLRWRTTSESNNAGFAVLHNGGEVTFVEGRGTTDIPQQYSFHIEDLPAGKHAFQLKQIDFDGTFAFSQKEEISISLNQPYTLVPPYPNPFNPHTTFSLTLGNSQDVSITLFDMLGRQVLTIYEGQLTANTAHTFTIDGSQLPSGTFMYQVVGANFRKLGHVVLLK